MDDTIETVQPNLRKTPFFAVDELEWRKDEVFYGKR